MSPPTQKAGARHDTLRARLDEFEQRERKLEGELDALVDRVASLISAIAVALPVNRLPFRIVAELEECVRMSGMARPW